MTLTEFLLARIAEDEDVARRATQGSPSGDGYGPWRESYDDGPAVSVFGYPSDRIIVRADEWEDQEHVIRWQPARVLAECEVKRRIVERAQRAGSAVSPSSFALVEALLLLAMPYADHPDYRDEWKP